MENSQSRQWHHRLQLASINDVGLLLPLVEAYHSFEEIEMSNQHREQALQQLLSDPSLGRIWLIFTDSTLSGYIALTFGYSIEFGGQDAFIDELYIQPEFRGQGLGQQTLIKIQQEARALDIQALHLEVARQNTAAQRFYIQANFQSRNKYMLMSARLA